MQSLHLIETWYTKNTKLYKIESINELKVYLVNLNKDVDIASAIQFSSDYEFKYFDLVKINCKDIKIRAENIFKLNFLMIVKALNKYFKNSNVNIEIQYEVPGENDKLIKKYNSTFKHDAYIKISNNNNYYDIGLEYFEPHHDRIKDNDKLISSIVNLNGYYVYEEKKNNYNDFMHETIHNLLTCICALNHDPYTLAKINYFKNYKETKTLKKDTEFFNNIIKWKKDNFVDLKSFFNKIRPKNQETEERFEYDEFLEYLEEIYNIKIELIDNYCSYENIVKIIIKLDYRISTIINDYKEIYQRAMQILFDSQEQIINFIEKSNIKIKSIPMYINYFLMNHIQNYISENILSSVLQNLLSKFKSNIVISNILKDLKIY
jgi:hypothetical protein